MPLARHQPRQALRGGGPELGRRRSEGIIGPLSGKCVCRRAYPPRIGTAPRGIRQRKPRKPSCKVLDQRVKNHLYALHPLLHQLAQPLILPNPGPVLASDPRTSSNQDAQLLVVSHVLFAERVQNVGKTGGHVFGSGAIGGPASASSSQLMRAVFERSSTCGPRRVEKKSNAQLTKALIRLRTPVIK
jgi:hypothetical protein